MPGQYQKAVLPGSSSLLWLNLRLKVFHVHASPAIPGLSRHARCRTSHAAAVGAATASSNPRLGQVPARNSHTPYPAFWPRVPPKTGSVARQDLNFEACQLELDWQSVQGSKQFSCPWCGYQAFDDRSFQVGCVLTAFLEECLQARNANKRTQAGM